jgi:glc operon protein GlcG
MYQRPTLSLSQVRNAMNAMLDKAEQEPDRPLAIAILDADAKMLSYARMDNCRALPQRMAVSKAYTSALSGQNSLDYAERLKGQGRSVADMGDPALVAVQGAVAVLHPGTGAVLGAIGVSGLSAQEDEDLAKLGLDALGL